MLVVSDEVHAPLTYPGTEFTPLLRVPGAGDVAVTVTSAPAAAGLRSRAEALGRGDALLGALRGDVLAMCVGPVTAGPLQERGIPVVWPDRARISALVRRLAEELPGRRPDGGRPRPPSVPGPG